MFKVGDQVKVVKIVPTEDDYKGMSLFIGQVGQVTAVAVGICPIRVCLPDGTLHFEEEELELCSK